MLSRTEIINQLAEKAGVPYLEAAHFMEIFLYKLSELLVEDDTFKIDKIGKFQISSPHGSASQSSAKGKIFLCTFEGGQGSCTFSAPGSLAKGTNVIDSFLSIGINRKFIPVRGEQYVPDSLPSNANETRKLLEQKAALILQQGSLIRGKNENSFNILTESSSLSTESFLSFAVPKINLEEDTEADPEDTSWEFGSDWKKEYEEDLLLDSDADDISDEDFEVSISRASSSARWDFGDDEKNESPSVSKSQPLGSKSVKEPKEFDLDSFAPVKSMTRELEIDLSELESEQEEEADSEEEDYEEENYEDDVLPEDFDALFKKSLAENVLSVGAAHHLDVEGQYSDEDDLQGIHLPEDDESIVDTSLVGSADAIDLRGRKLTRHISPEEDMEFNGIKDTIERNPAKKQKSYILYYVLSFIILTFGGTLVYTKLYGTPKWAEDIVRAKEKEIVLKASTTSIERDYAFPVSYPYERVGTVIKPKPAAVDTAANKVKQEVPPAKEEKKVEPPVAQKEQPKVQPPPAKEAAKAKTESKVKAEPAKLPSSAAYKGAFIEPVAGKFEIQVLSSPASDVSGAEKAAARLRSLGYNAFVVQKDIPNRGIYNRVRVGPFASRQEAEKALTKLKGE